MMTKQEMFDKAVRGLASQGWKRCRNPIVDQCVYSNDQGMHCAWGWVDESLKGELGGIMELRNEEIGLASSMDDDLAYFAVSMQKGHDNGFRPYSMLLRFRSICDENHLIWPSDVPITLA